MAGRLVFDNSLARSPAKGEDEACFALLSTSCATISVGVGYVKWDIYCTMDQTETGSSSSRSTTLELSFWSLSVAWAEEVLSSEPHCFFDIGEVVRAGHLQAAAKNSDREHNMALWTLYFMPLHLMTRSEYSASSWSLHGWISCRLSSSMKVRMRKVPL